MRGKEVPGFVVDEIKRVNKNDLEKRSNRNPLGNDKMNDRIHRALMRLDTSAFSISNEVVFGTQPYATVVEAKLLRLLLSQFYSKNCGNDNNFVYTVTVKDLCKKIGIYSEKTKHSMYDRIKKTVIGLQARTLFICDGERWRSINWLQEVCYENGKISIALNDVLIPYIKDLKGNFSVLSLDTIVRFENRYAMRLYEILYAQVHKDAVRRKDYYGCKKVELEFALDDFRLSLSTYGIYNDITHLKIKCIIPAVQEINKITDMTIVDFKLSANAGRKMDTIMFILSLKKHIVSRNITDNGNDSYKLKGFEDLYAIWNKKCEDGCGLEPYRFIEEKDVACFSDLLDSGITQKDMEETIDIAANAEYFKKRYGGTFENYLKKFRKIANGSYTQIFSGKNGKNKDVNHLSDEDRRWYAQLEKEDEAWFDALPCE